MKRLLLIASVAILAAGCQKTFVDNEVQTPIGFSTEVGKQTRAIAQESGRGSGEYFETQPFAVYAHAYQNEEFKNTVMNNVAVSYQDEQEKWKAYGNTTYYWPNDPRTKIDFFAYSPAHADEGNATDADKVLSGTIAHSRTLGLSLTNYVHSNMYVDFMVATPVRRATYTDQNGEAANVVTGSVPLSFHHQMTQVVFKVKTGAEYNGVTFTLNSIKFNRIEKVANYIQDYADEFGAWTTQGSLATYNNVFPSEGQQAQSLSTSEFSTTPVTMIPQTLTPTDESTSDRIIANGGQSFTVEYEISGTGVATETVVKTFEFADAGQTDPVWAPNKKITYTLTIGLNEITFSPEVDEWDPSSGEYDM